MRHRILAALVGLTFLHAFSPPVLAQSPNPTRPAGASATANSATRALSDSDKNFLEDNLTAGLAAVEASKLMLGKSTDPKLKQFAQRVIQEQGALNDELAALASIKGLAAASEPNMLQRTQLKALTALDGEEADKMYARQFGVVSQQKSLLDFENASAKADDTEIRAFAESRVAGLRVRVNQARSLGLTDRGM